MRQSIDSFRESKDKKLNSQFAYLVFPLSILPTEVSR